MTQPPAARPLTDSASESAGARLQMRILSHPGNVAVVRRAVEDLAARNGFDAKACDDIGLCVNEALANIVRHAYAGAVDQPIFVTAGADDACIRITIRDWGAGVDPQCLPEKPYDPLTPGGVGLICLKQLMDEVLFERQSDGMLLTLARRRNRPSAQ